MNPLYPITQNYNVNQLINNQNVPWKDKLFTNCQFIKTLEAIETLCENNPSLLKIKARKLIGNLLDHFKEKKYEDINFTKKKLESVFIKQRQPRFIEKDGKGNELTCEFMMFASFSLFVTPFFVPTVLKGSFTISPNIFSEKEVKVKHFSNFHLDLLKKLIDRTWGN